MTGKWLAACAVLALAASASHAADPDAATQFGARESIEGISLSPDGNKIAYIAPRGARGSSLYIVDLATGDSHPAATVDGAPQRMSSCRWVANTRLVCTIYSLIDTSGYLLPFSRLIAVDDDGKNMKRLSEQDSIYQRSVQLYGGGVIDWLPGEDGKVLMERNFVPELKGNTRLEKKDEGLGIDRVDTRTLTHTRVESPRKNAVEFISDGRGEVRIMGIQPTLVAGRAARVINYTYRPKGGSEWKSFSTYDILDRTGLNPLAVDPDLDVAYALKKKDGRQALYKVALDGSLGETLVFAHPEVDVSGVVRIGRSQRVVGVRYVTDRSHVDYFDPAIEKLAASLSKALPKQPSLQVAGASLDESKLLLWAGGDTDPGRYYIFDKAKRGLNEIMLARPELEQVPLATVRVITYPAADGTKVPAYLTLPPGKESAKGLPAIVLPHGGPEARDDWGFDWLSQYFANRGFAVLQPNFRGSTGYGDTWFQQNGFRSWKVAVGDVTDAGRWMVSSGLADPAKLAIFGWSYGGYAALQSAVIAPGLFKAVVAVAPVTDFRMTMEESRGWTDYQIERERIGDGPHLVEGSPALHANAFQAPVLMFHGDMDRNVGIAQSRAMAARLKAAGKPEELVVYPGLDHYLEDSTARADMLRRSDAFLRTSMHL